MGVDGHLGFRSVEGARPSAGEVDELLPGALPALLGLLVGKGCIGAEVDLAQHTEKVHDLVVAEQHDDLSTGRFCLGFEPHQQVEDLAQPRRAVDDVAHLDQGCVAAGPAQGLVDEAGLAEDRSERLDVSVEIADCHHSSARARRRR